MYGGELQHFLHKKNLEKLKNESTQIAFICIYSCKRVQKLIKYRWVTKNSKNWITDRSKADLNVRSKVKHIF